MRKYVCVSQTSGRILMKFDIKFDVSRNRIQRTRGNNILKKANEEVGYQLI